MYSDGSFFNYKKDPNEYRSITRAAATKEENAIRDKFRAILDKLPKWKMGDKPVKQVILPGYELKKKVVKQPSQNKGQQPNI